MSSNADFWPTFFFGAFCSAIITGTILCFVGAELGRNEERRQAVKAGVAHYETDRSTGEYKFVYRGR